MPRRHDSAHGHVYPVGSCRPLQRQRLALLMLHQTRLSGLSVGLGGKIGGCREREDLVDQHSWRKQSDDSTSLSHLRLSKQD